VGWQHDRFDAGRPQNLVETGAELGIAIVQQITATLTVWRLALYPRFSSAPAIRL